MLATLDRLEEINLGGNNLTGAYTYNTSTELCSIVSVRSIVVVVNVGSRKKQNVEMCSP